MLASPVMQSEANLMLSVVVPVWGERHDLTRMLPALRTAVDGIDVSAEILVCGDGLDEAVQDLIAQADGVYLPSKLGGYGDILQTGLAAARGEFVLTIDADFAYVADFVQVMWAHRESAEVVIGSRYVRGAVAEMGFGRRFASRVLNGVYRFFLSVPYKDISSGFRLYRRRVLLDIQPLEPHGLDILPEILVKALCQGWQVTEVPFWYRGSRPWNRTRMARFGTAYLATLGRLLSLRNSVRAADYDNRAFDSWVPLQRAWQRRRFEIVHAFMGPQAGRLTLDIGCGSSRIVQTLPGIVGMDLAMHKLRWLRAPGRYLVRGSLTEVPFHDGAFDTVICSGGDRAHPSRAGAPRRDGPGDRAGRSAHPGHARLQQAAVAVPRVALREGLPERLREGTHQPVHAGRPAARPRRPRAPYRRASLRRRAPR